jgi:sugar (pentulose or hexulose) kinase
MPKYNHACTIAFVVLSDNEADKVTREEFLSALLDRVAMLVRNEEDIINDCVVEIFDTYEEDTEDA